MKYDAGMTGFHKNIVAAIKSMIHVDSDKVAELAAEGSPVPLKDYLREHHGKTFHGGNTFECMSSAFLVKFDNIINNDGDTKLQLSWSQVSTFIRKYPSEIFSEDEPVDDDIQPDRSSLELLCNTFDESEIKCPFWHTGETMRYLNFGGVDFKCDYCDCSFCEFDKLTEFLASHCYNYEDCLYYRKHKDDKSEFPCDDCGYDLKGCCNYPETPDDYCVCGDKKIPVPAQTDTAVAAFDYSVLDNDTAHSLKECETVIRTETAGYFTLLGAKFKEAQDLLANHSSGTFEQWYTAMGFKRQTVYNLIQRFEFSSSPTIGGREEAFEALPLTLSYEISKPAAPAELVEKVLDGDITTNAEYRRLKAELDEAHKQLELAESHKKQILESYDEIEKMNHKHYEDYEAEHSKNVELEKRIKELNQEAEEAEQEYNAIAEREDQYETKICELNCHIKELEARPVEASFTDNSEELEKKDKEISELKEEIERLSDRKVKVFAIKLTLDEYEKLVGIVRDSNDLVVMEAVKKAQIIRL